MTTAGIGLWLVPAIFSTMARKPFVPYPRHVHKPGGVFLEVNSDEERDAAVAEGWWLSPDGPPKPVVDVDAPVSPKRKPGRPKKARPEE